MTNLLSSVLVTLSLLVNQIGQETKVNTTQLNDQIRVDLRTDLINYKQLRLTFYFEDHNILDYVDFYRNIFLFFSPQAA